MKPYVLPLSDSQATLENVGGKGMSLAKLAWAALPVPDGFHITTEAYRQFVAANDLQPKILAALRTVEVTLPATLETASRTIREFFEHSHIPAEVSDAVVDSYQALEDPHAVVAVRSSATAEDLPEASFAGQQETYLNIQGIDEVLGAVKRCWASLWTARAIAYRIKNNIDQKTLALAVVVQKLVFADAAGIMFTANPVSGDREEILINAAWGLGEAIVAGAVTPDTIVVDKKKGRVIRRETAEKSVMTVRTDLGTQEVPVPDSKKNKQVLSNAQAKTLARYGKQIESLYGMPMDIEWALANGEFAIVQARPITSLPDALEWKLPHPKAMLARGSFAEFVPEPISPLFATLAVPIAHRSTMKLMSGIGVTGENNYLFAVLNDYVYVGFVFTPKLTWQMLKATFTLLGPIMKTARQRAITAREEFLAAIQKWHVREPAMLTPSELLSGVREIFTETAEYYNMAQSGTIPTSMIREFTFARFYNAFVKRRSDPDASIFVFGAENHALRSEKALFDLAMWAKEQPELTDYLTRTPADEFCAALQHEPKPVHALAEFSARFDRYLREFGHTIYDLDFAKPTPAEAPEALVETLKVYLAGKNNPYERQRAALERREQAAERIIKRLDPLRRKYFIKLLKEAQDTAPLRENSIADMGLGHPQIRRMLGELGKRLAAGGAIGCAEDVYWLESQEVDALATHLERSETLKDFSAAVESRKAKWEAMRHIIPPTTLPKVSWMTRFFPSNEGGGNTIKGFAASTGKVTARACVMLGPEDFDKMRPGDVIVAGITTPAWTPLFARASAIVTDIGGPLSHSSIVAREYGIPAVLATGVATRRVKDGQMITVDGGAGIVSLN
ncbi:MAG TPA: PEP/pyruvate-binding domain-containing protein [Anaerolineales bacterium]|nr:PEP/pyruvate-binding domain-containing protein [Anaerolineales bacterium]